MRFRWALPTSFLIILALASPAQAVVDRADLQEAADRLAAARSEAAGFDDEYRATLREEAALKDLLAELIGTVETVRADVVAARSAAAERIDEIYMRAGTRHGADLIVTGTVTEGWVRIVYAGAVADVDREVIVTLEASELDLVRLQARLDDALADQRALASRVADQAGAAAERLADAEADYQRVRAEWDWQEEQRRLAEAAAAPSTTTQPATSSTTAPGTETTEAAPATTTTTEPGATTTTVPAPTTTTTVPAPPTTTIPEPVPGGPFAAPVERWRPLVEQYFPAGMVNEALSVMTCESFGDPDATNPYSGAAGLFQHLPKYWPERAEGAGFPDASPFNGEANIAATRWLVDRSLALDLDAWYFWSCKP